MPWQRVFAVRPAGGDGRVRLLLQPLMPSSSEGGSQPVGPGGFAQLHHAGRIDPRDAPPPAPSPKLTDHSQRARERRQLPFQSFIPKDFLYIPPLQANANDLSRPTDAF